MKLYDTALVSFARSRIGGWLFINVFNRVDRVLMGWTNARIHTGIGSKFQKTGVLLRCTGARSGLVREVPLLATPVPEGYVLVASKAGAAEHPAWYRNLKANPECSLAVGGQILDFVAQEAEGATRERLWNLAVENYAGYHDYQKRTQRLIPVMLLVSRNTNSA
jgi:deazaflavin-dependent oxidoreductase (nitroreductase family)